MAEETTTSTSATAESTGTVATPAPTQATEDSSSQSQSTPAFDITNFIEPDGRFKEGWKNALVPEELRGEKFFDAWGKDIQSLIKVAGNQAKTIGKYATTKGVLPINEKSTPAEIANYRAALGVPPDGKGYKYTPPEDISSEDLSPEYLTESFEILNKKAHLTQSQLDVVMGLYTGHLKQVEQAVNAELERGVADAQKQLETEYGDRLDERLNLSKEFVTKMASGWNPEKYNMLFGEEVKLEDGTTTREGGINDPEFAHLRPLLIDLFATIEEKYGQEHSALTSEATGGGPAKSVQTQIDELKATPGFLDGALRTSLNPKDRDKHKEILNRLDVLYGKLISSKS